MVPVRTALIVGGGIGGMSAALELRRLGIEVELIDLDPHWRVYGAGITITGPTLRAFQQLGVFEAVAARAYTGDGIRVCDVQGRELSILPTPRAAGANVPGSGGIMRPVLHAILSERVRASGARVRLGLSVQSLQQLADAVGVRFTDESEGRYDLLVGADGLFSRTRTLLFADAPPPQYTGQCIWRAVLPRPVEIDRRHFFLGGLCKVGLSPVSATEMYLFLLERSEQKRYVPEQQLPAQLAKLLEPYGGILGRIREQLDESSRIVLRPLEAFLLPPPWYQGRAVLIGDAAHPTTPQLASGAGMAVEDALVLAQELERARSVQQALQAFMQRRYERCQLVVRNSLEIGRREQSGASVAAQTELVEQSLAALAAPI
jgi:2-polyprenyl-6-methoxyphenol hydroxylase-like FAD-dependent oxidoreductase